MVNLVEKAGDDSVRYGVERRAKSDVRTAVAKVVRIRGFDMVGAESRAGGSPVKASNRSVCEPDSSTMRIAAVGIVVSCRDPFHGLAYRSKVFEFALGFRFRSLQDLNRIGDISLRVIRHYLHANAGSTFRDRRELDEIRH